ncbi:MAG TPA: hypothetical protein VNK89_08915, partial [Thermoflexus sp.]|nr:hypothetical protein [Thermoflexus sp.]
MTARSGRCPLTLIQIGLQGASRRASACADVGSGGAGRPLAGSLGEGLTKYAGSHATIPPFSRYVHPGIRGFLRGALGAEPRAFGARL